ncbi:hypothetical protein I4U23_019825 [Adineta vaga]|nr:hypothetical protein I4U23_019825 [Adineta vaga]
MATSNSQKAPCVTCGKVTGLFTCRGCQQDFCTRHVAEHRQELGKQMDELSFEHDRLRQILLEPTTDLKLHPFIIDINEWEQQSIDRIHQIANDARKQLEISILIHRTKFNEDLTKIANELKKAHEDDDYFETDLRQWIEKIDQLKKELIQPSNVKLSRVYNDILSSIPRVIETTSSKEVFQQSTDGVQIEENGHVITKTIRSTHATVRGSGEYTNGQHQFRFRIERYSQPGWIQIAIVCKNIPLQANCYDTRSLYGWAGSNQVYIDGKNYQGHNGYQVDIETNDILEFIVDCDRRIIRLTNERTHSSSILNIDIQHCPFPWQLSFGLYNLQDRVRILHA